MKSLVSETIVLIYLFSENADKNCNIGDFCFAERNSLGADGPTAHYKAHSHSSSSWVEVEAKTLFSGLMYPFLVVA